MALKLSPMNWQIHSPLPPREQGRGRRIRQSDGSHNCKCTGLKTDAKATVLVSVRTSTLSLKVV
ncbi:hypothetical protein FJZ31_40815 [Candidatus Poribacteria bacterium]|nr:hypothetical protein [Candidatus Poribacteria bacterium]